MLPGLKSSANEQVQQSSTNEVLTGGLHASCGLTSCLYLMSYQEGYRCSVGDDTLELDPGGVEEAPDALLYCGEPSTIKGIVHKADKHYTCINQCNSASVNRTRSPTLLMDPGS